MHDRAARVDERMAARAMMHGDIGTAMALDAAAARERREGRIDRAEARMHDRTAAVISGSGRGFGPHPHHHHHGGPMRYGPGITAAEVGLGIAAGAMIGGAIVSTASRSGGRTPETVMRPAARVPPGYFPAGTPAPAGYAAPPAPAPYVVAPPGSMAAYPVAYPGTYAVATAPPPTAYATATAPPPESGYPMSPASPFTPAAAAAATSGVASASPVTLRVTGVRKHSDGVVRYSVQVRTTLPALLTAARAHPECASVDVISGVEVASYVLNKRYNDFKSLHETMEGPARRAGVVLGPLPAGGVGQWLRKDDASLWAERQAAFARLLAHLTSTPALWSTGYLSVWLIPRPT